MTVYVDVLIATNIFVNYLLLLSAKRILSQPTKTVRLLLASGVGALYSLIIFVDNLPAYVKIPMNIAVLSLITFIAFNPRKLRSFFRQAGAFLLVNFIFAGLMFALWYFVAPDRMLYNNFIVYFDIDVRLLIVLSAACYVILIVIMRIVSRFSSARRTVSVTLTYSGKSVTANALVDTGHSLTDGFTGMPVVIADAQVVRKLTGNDLYELINRQTEGASELCGRIRLIPVSTVSSDSMLAAFRVDSVIIGNHSRFDRCLLAQSKSAISADYSIIISDSLLREE